jgi:RNA polymerase sigma-70 factor (ECF subfamily)
MNDLCAADVDEARAADPDVDLPPALFAAFLTTLAVRGVEPRRELLPELYLACACSVGCPAAHRSFDRRHLTRLPAAVLRIDRSPAFHDEVRQAARIRLLLPERGRRPRIALYTGRGPLGAWTRVVVTRIAASLRLVEARDRWIAEPVIDGGIAVNHAERDLIRSRHLGVFQAAIKRALDTLGPDDRDRVHRRFIDDQPVAHIAAVHGVHPATVQRWLLRSTAQLAEYTRGFLARDLAASPAEVDDLIAALRDDPGAGLDPLLGDPDDPDAG